ncbi:hypothetical protein [Chitinophaga defluvii]|uniref:Uncharacterized protein n=1 Tax=Chitinophaga defluvii TaxID=3163343 RepID=A0ABV2T9T3_9BACT
MKKLKISAFAAIAVAIVLGLSAFTTVKKSQRLLQQYPYWYETTDGSHVAAIKYSNTAQPLAQDELIPNNVDVPCDFSGETLCMRGSTVARTIGQNLPSAAPDSDINKQN